MKKDEIVDLIQKRWSPYAFSSSAIDESKFNSLFEAASRAPSSNNEQPWIFVYVTQGNMKIFNDYLGFLYESNRVKEELIKSGKLGPDNYIDEEKRLKESEAEEKMAPEDRNAENSEEDKPKESQEMAANYKGPTRIYYDLAGRNHTYLPIPIYKCQGSGKVELSIEVNQKGIVEKATVITGESTTTESCLIETAVKTAYISRFNPDINSPKIQKGTLSYHFVAQ